MSRRDARNWLLTSLALFVLSVGCHATVPPSTARQRDEPGWSRIVVRAPLELPAGLRMSPGVALVGSRANPGLQEPGPFRRVEAFPVALRCRTPSVCTLTIRNRLSVAVFAFDPVVEVDIVPSSEHRGGARVRYLDPQSVSAALAELVRLGVELESACLDRRLGQQRRLELAAPLERRLRVLAAGADRDTVARAAGLALVQGQCTGAPENRAIAKALLDSLEPTAPELGPWAEAVRRLAPLTDDPARATTFVDAVIERHPDPAVGAWLLFRRLTDLGEDSDPRTREAIERRLESPRFAKTASPAMAKSLSAARNSIGLVPGDAWPPVELAGVNGGTIRSGDSSGRPQLWYFGASWCKGCVEALPKLGRLSAAHPELRIVYVLWDTLSDAQDFVESRAPVLGEVAWTDISVRQRLRSQVMTFVALPSFVLVDTDGTVLATSDDITLGQLDTVLPTRQEGAAR